MIISNKHGIYKFSHELRNDLRLRILGNWEVLGKSSNLPLPSPPLNMKVLPIVAESLLKIEIEPFL